MPWDVKDVKSQRIEFVARAVSGKETITGLCQEYGISRPTGYLWIKRYRKRRRFADLEEESRRPRRSPGRDRGGGGRSCRRLAQADRLEWEKDQPGTVGAGTDSDWTSDGGSNYPAVWTDPGAGSTAIGAQSFRARGTESTLADGYERPVPGGIGGTVIRCRYWTITAGF